MNAPAHTTSATTARLGVVSGLAGLLLVATLASAAPAGASIPVEHESPATATTSTLVLVNGVNTLAGVAAKVARLR